MISYPWLFKEWINHIEKVKNTVSELVETQNQLINHWDAKWFTVSKRFSRIAYHKSFDSEQGLQSAYTESYVSIGISEREHRDIFIPNGDENNSTEVGLHKSESPPSNRTLLICIVYRAKKQYTHIMIWFNTLYWSPNTILSQVELK